MPEVTPVILAGGRSERMGSDKWALVVDGMPLLELQIRRILKGFPKVVVVTRETKKVAMLLLRVKDKIQIVEDGYKQVAPIFGIRTAFDACAGDGIFAMACDMPFVTASAMEHVISQSTGFDACCVESEPLFCCYLRSCVPKVDFFIREREYSLTELLQQLHTNRIILSDAGLLFANLNTPQDLQSHIEDIRTAMEQL